MRIFNVLFLVFAWGIGVDERIERAFWYAHDGFEDEDMEDVSGEDFGGREDAFDVGVVADYEEGFWARFDDEGVVFCILDD